MQDAHLNNKVVFEDGDEEETSKHDNNINSNFEYNSHKKRLFEDNNDEDDMEYNFETKEQFQGQKGKKVFGMIFI